MKLLLVDDEEYVIESIKRNLDLTETGVNEVYTAFSVQQAKNIMGMVDIDIVISDIVMPGGTGFDFVEWVRKEELKVQVIFLTSYAEFDYARRAIQLNSVDYLLKPIDFDKLKEAVQRAAESVAKEKKIQDLRQESIKWNQNRKILQQDIWKNVLKDGFSEEKFCETAAQRQLPYGPGHYFRLICLMPEIKSNKREIWDTATMEFVIENVLSELYEETDIAVDTVFYQEPGSYREIKLAKEGNPHAIDFPRAHMEDAPYDFSFSGVKSAVLNHLNKCRMTGEPIVEADIAASFQQAVVDVLVDNAIRAAKDYHMDRLAIAGGVASNGALRAAMEAACEKEGIRFYRPSPIFCTDNAAMIGVAAYYEYQKGTRHGWDLNAVPNLKLGER